MVGLEVLLNFMQALIFAVLTLMFTIIAIERHHEEEHEAPHLPEGNIEPSIPRGAAHDRLIHPHRPNVPASAG